MRLDVTDYGLAAARLWAEILARYQLILLRARYAAD